VPPGGNNPGENSPKVIDLAKKGTKEIPKNETTLEQGSQIQKDIPPIDGCSGPVIGGTRLRPGLRRFLGTIRPGSSEVVQARNGI